MAWLAANAERRKSPRAIWPDVKSIIMLGMSYGPERDPLEALASARAAPSPSMRKAPTITT